MAQSKLTRLVNYNHISNCLCIKERALTAGNTFQPLTASVLAPKPVKNADTPHNLSPRQKGAKWEQLWVKGGMESGEERGKKARYGESSH